MLIASFALKLCFIIVEVALAVAFGVTERTGMYNISAILEWIVALIYIFCESSFLSSLSVTGRASSIRC